MTQLLERPVPPPPSSARRKQPSNFGIRMVPVVMILLGILVSLYPVGGDLLQQLQAGRVRQSAEQQGSAVPAELGG